MRRGAQAVDARGVVVEGERDELVERAGSSRGAGSATTRKPSSSPARTPIARASAGAPGLGELDERADDRRDEQPLALGAPARGSARRAPAAGVAASSSAVVAPDRDLDRRRVAASACAPSSARPWRSASSSSARSRAVAAAGAAAPPASASARPRRAHRAVASIAAWKASRAGAPWTANTIRSSCDPAARWRADLLDLDPRGLVDREAADAGAEGDEREAARAQLVRAAQRRRRRAADDVGRRRPAELHRRGVDDPAARHLAARGLDRRAEPDGRDLARLLVDRRAAGARDRGRDAAAVQQLACWRRWRSRRPRAS